MKIYLLTLGCPKNLVDSEILRGGISGESIRFVDYPDDADTIIINTCGFLESAREEAIEATLEAAELKKNGSLDKLIIMGCMPQKFGSSMNEIKQEIPQVDAVFGVNSIPDVIKFLGEKKELKYDPTYNRILLTPPHYAYLKIAEGCDNECSFCLIPQIRGRQISRSVEELLRESEILAGRGVKELILIAQDTTSYGWDLKPKRYLQELLAELEKIPGIEWIRILYGHPSHFSEKLIPVMVDSPKIVPYIDLPIQHISDRILKSMRRGLNSAGVKKLLDKIRENIPGIAIRTSLIVGYPGETEREFEELLSFIKEYRFERLGVFTYSAEEGTIANSLKDNVPTGEKETRREAIMLAQQDISFSNNQSLIGKTLKVLIDKSNDKETIGRTVYDAPEIDNDVIIQVKNRNIPEGKFQNVKIVQCDPYSLFGTIDD